MGLYTDDLTHTRKVCQCFTTGNVYTENSARVQGYCLGTPEISPCECWGECEKCDFYETVRKEAQEQKIVSSTDSDIKLTHAGRKPLTQQEVINAINEAAEKANKYVPQEVYERLLKK